MNNLIKAAKHLPVPAPTPAISISSVTLNVVGREIPLEMRVTAPISGTSPLPIILFSHGHGPSYYIPSKDGYAPLRDFYAERGFAVIQPTHLNSKVAGLPMDAPGGPLFLSSRVQDMKSIIDRLDEIEEQATFLKGRLDRSSIATLGHSLGALTVSSLLGAGITESGSKTINDWSDSRIKAGVLLGPPGTGGKDDLTEIARDKYLFPDTDFSTMATPALMVVGDEDHSTHLTTRGVDWHRDPFHKSNGPKDMLTLVGGGHGCGGVAAYDAKETDDEDPERLAIVQRMTLAYLKTALATPCSGSGGHEDGTWQDNRRAMQLHCSSFGQVESRQ